MAERELGIILKARTTLNDVGATPRWTTQRLMELLSEGQDAMCRDIPLISYKAMINTVGGQEEYNLPSDAVRLLHASNAGVPVVILSYDEIEHVDGEWETATGHAVTNIIVNALSQQVIRPYPLTETTEQIKVRYHARPIELGWDEDSDDSMEELTISDMWDEGLKQYIIGQAFLDYGDDASTTRAGTALAMYQKVYDRAMKLSKKSFAKRVITTKFQGRVASSINIGGRYGYRNSRH